MRRGDVSFMGFNQDATCVSVGTSAGYGIFNCNPFGRNLVSLEGGVKLVEMLFCTSLVAVVEEPRHLKLWNTKTNNAICELDFDSEIVSIKMNRKRLVVLLETSLHIYDLDSMANLQTLEVAKPSLCELSPDENNSFLALPAHSSAGDVFLYDALNLVEFRWMNAHQSPLVALKFSLDGTMLATASETGTVIRVFRVPSGEKLYCFRRGTYSATVFSLAFDPSHTMLAASSSNGTIHVFQLENQHPNTAPVTFATSLADEEDTTGQLSEHVDALDPSTSAIGTSTATTAAPTSATSNVQASSLSSSSSSSASSSIFGIAASSALHFLDRRKQLAGYLPNSISEIVEPSRSFAIARLKNSKVVSVCALGKGGVLFVVTSIGQFYQYKICKGDCQLEFEMSLQVNEREEEGLTRFFK